MFFFLTSVSLYLYISHVTLPKFFSVVCVSVGGHSDYFHSSKAPVTKEMSKHSAECQILGAGVCSVMCQQLTCLNRGFWGKLGVVLR